MTTWRPKHRGRRPLPPEPPRDLPVPILWVVLLAILGAILMGLFHPDKVQEMVPSVFRICTIKGNINGQGEAIYHTLSSPYYWKTQINTSRGERWFCSVAEAETAGWRAPY